MEIIRKTYKGYKILFEEWPDPRTKPWALVAKPYQGAAILGLYLLFVFKWGPAWMKNKKPYNLDKVLMVYNIAQMLFCFYIFFGAWWYAWGGNYKWICQPVNLANTEDDLNVARFVYYYFLTKILDLLDTIFFVLRKKFNQITFLHVYHHTGMVMLIWGAATYFPGGHGTLIGLINCFVHTVMYGYYFFTVAYPVYKQSLWWKKYITQLQILQFFLCVVHMSTIVFKPDCEYPRWTSAVFLPQNLFMLILFIDFYIKSYIKKPKLEAENKTKLETEMKLIKESNGVPKQNGDNNEKNGKHNGYASNNGAKVNIINDNGVKHANNIKCTMSDDKKIIRLK